MANHADNEIIHKLFGPTINCPGLRVADLMRLMRRDSHVITVYEVLLETDLTNPIDLEQFIDFKPLPDYADYVAHHCDEPLYEEGLTVLMT